jgi:5-methyltetrahydropteroyltriglutamate--homocysteine methyltransferase
MARPSDDVARAEVVGSLLRPPELRAAVDRFYADGHHAVLAEERAADRSALDAVEDACIREAVARQRDLGLDVVTDGEFRRWMFLNSFWDAVEGFSTDANPVEFRADDGSTITWNVQRIEDRLAPVASPAAHEAAFLTGLPERGDTPFKVTFPAASLFALPFTFKPGVNDHAYRDLDELVDHCVEIERGLVADAVAAGCRYVQFDFPAYPYFCDPRWIAAIEELGWTVDAALEVAVRADRAVLEGLPDDVTTAMHVCRGNNQSRYVCEGPLDPVAETLFALPYDVLLVEWEDPARMGGFSALDHLPADGPVVVLGLITSKTPTMVDDDAVVARIEEAARHSDLDRLALSTQCGFASTLPGNAVTPDDQWAKLAQVVRIAHRVWS